MKGNNKQGSIVREAVESYRVILELQGERRLAYTATAVGANAYDVF